jgi:hypothetical protein
MCPRPWHRVSSRTRHWATTHCAQRANVKLADRPVHSRTHPTPLTRKKPPSLGQGLLVKKHYEVVDLAKKAAGSSPTGDACPHTHLGVDDEYPTLGHPNFQVRLHIRVPVPKTRVETIHGLGKQLHDAAQRLNLELLGDIAASERRARVLG